LQLLVLDTKVKTRLLATEHSCNFECFTVVVVVLLLFASGTGNLPAAEVGDSVPKKCITSDVKTLVTNIVPLGVCEIPSDSITLRFDVNIWGNPKRYNFTIGYTRANDSVLQDVKCLDTGLDLDNTECEDYNGSGTELNPVATSAFFDVSCDLEGNGVVEAGTDIDFYVSMGTNAGSDGVKIDSPKCKLQENNAFPILPASLTLLKSVVNDDGGTQADTEWILEANIGESTAELSGISGVTDNALPAGNYILSETGPPGYTLTGISCSGAAFDRVTNTLTLAPKDVATCVFSSDDLPQTYLTLSKTLINNSGGTLRVEDFDLSIDGNKVRNNMSNVVAPEVDIIISELDLPGYKKGTWNCIDSKALTSMLPTNGIATNTVVNLAQGADVKCSIINDDQPADIRLIKQVSDSSPMPGEIVTYHLNVDNIGSATALNLNVVDVLPVGLTYVPGTITGGDGADDSNWSTSGLTWGIASLIPGAGVTLSFQAIVGSK